MSHQNRTNKNGVYTFGRFKRPLCTKELYSDRQTYSNANISMTKF